MPDPADLASRTIEEAERIRDLQRAAHNSKPRHVSEFCVDCEDPIPQARQEATGGTNRCVSCQSYFSIRNGGR